MLSNLSHSTLLHHSLGDDTGKDAGLEAMADSKSILVDLCRFFILLMLQCYQACQGSHHEGTEDDEDDEEGFERWVARVDLVGFRRKPKLPICLRNEAPAGWKRSSAELESPCREQDTTKKRADIQALQKRTPPPCLPPMSPPPSLPARAMFGKAMSSKSVSIEEPREP